MDFGFSNLKQRLLVAGVALAAAYSVEAQPAEQRPGEAILFSSPDDGDGSSNMPSLAAKPPELLDMANAVQSPALNFGALPQTARLPAPPAISLAEVRRMQRLIDERKNWALRTPEEILGLPTPEKILGIPDRDALGEPKDESVVARYYERQEQSRASTNNDNYGAADPASHWGFPDSRELQINPNIWAPAGSRPENPALVDQFLNGTADNRAGSGRAPENGWSKTFNLPAPTPGPTPEQQAAMEQFQQLLKPHALPGGTPKTPALGSPIFSTLSMAPNPAPGQLLIPIGASFAPLSSGIGMPAGVTPLPSLLGPNNPAPPAIAKEWKPQLPPWMSSAPQPGVVPQRKF